MESNLLDKINAKLDKKAISPAILLSQFRMINEGSRRSSAYTDPKYIPFYYYLGREIHPKNMVEIGFRLGLCSGAFFMGCKTVSNFLAFQQEKEDKFYSPRLGKRNILDKYKGNFSIYVGNINDENFEQLFKNNKWDLLIINEETTYDQHMLYLDFAWGYMNNDGIIIMDYVNHHIQTGKAYRNFCKAHSREFLIFNTKYGVGLIQK